MDVLATDGAGNVTTVTTDDNGDYEFTNLTAGTYQVQLPLSGVDASQTVTVSALDGTVVTVNLSNTFSSVLKGVVTDSDGNPLAGITVSLMQSGQEIDYLTTDSQGNYLFYIVAPGSYQLQASSLTASFPLVDGIQISADETVSQNIAAGSGTLQFTAVDSTRGVSGDTVALLPPQH